MQRCAISAIWERLPLASFIATIFFISDNFWQVWGKIFTPVLLGTLYKIIGSFVCDAIDV